MRWRDVLVIAFLLWSGQAMAATDWQHALMSPDGMFALYADPKSLTLQGPIRRIRLLYDYRKAQPDPGAAPARSTTMLISLDCVDRKIGTIQETRYANEMAQGTIVFKAPPVPRVNYLDVAPGSFNDKILQYVCTLKSLKAKRP